MKRFIAVVGTALAVLFASVTPASALPLGYADYGITAFSGEATVASGGTFTRTVVVHNDIDSNAGNKSVFLNINGVTNASFVSVTSDLPGAYCKATKFKTGALNQIECTLPIPSGADATVVVTYRAPFGWKGWTYTAAAFLRTNGDVKDVNPANDKAQQLGPLPTTTVV